MKNILFSILMVAGAVLFFGTMIYSREQIPKDNQILRSQAIKDYQACVEAGATREYCEKL